MDQERWKKIEETFQSAAECRPEDRDALLAAACGGDRELRREVESLLAQQSHDTPLDRPAWDMAAGGRLGPYELLESIGSGGMGTVFKARDTRLNRSVAIKVSSSQFSGRFANEARAAAALNHPHVCTLHDVGPNYLVMEFVEGENLAQHLQKGPLPLNLTLRYGVEIADAVAAAHSHGIIHRDLKPANIMLTESGVKVLDFGLAKFEKPGGAVEPQTASHAVVGTVAYMSPEQAEGKPVDARSDIFSLGALLYEMVTGKRPFRRDTEIATLAAVLNEEPQPLPESVPAELQRIISRCLRKDPARRFQTAGDLKVELEELKEESDSSKRPVAVSSQPRHRRWLWLGAMATVTLLLAADVVWHFRDAAPPSEPRAEALTAYPGSENYPSLSPDGTKVAFAWDGEKEDNVDIYVKRIDATGTPLRLTTDPSPDSAPAWSPDDRWIAFLRSEQGKVAIILISPLGVPERKLAENVETSSLSWTPDGKWLAYSSPDSQTGPASIWAVSVETAERRRLTTFVAQAPSDVPRRGDRSPSLSPDGRALVFTRLAKSYGYDLYSLRLTRDLRPVGEPVRITDQRYGAVEGIAWTAEGGEIVYSAGGAESESLWRFPVSGRGGPRRLPYALPTAVYPAIARSRARLVYTWWMPNRNLWRLDLRTKERKVLVGSTYLHGFPQYSPEGHKIAFQSNRSGNWEVWTCNSDGANCQQLTSFGGPQCGAPRWSPDGRWLALDSRSEGQSEIYVIAADGGPPRRLTDHPADDNVPSWSRDGQWIYFTSDRSGQIEIWKVPKEGGPAVQVTHSGGSGAFESPDGRYIYYTKWSLHGQLYSLFRMPAQGGEETQILPRVLFPNYGVTSKGIYFASERRTIQFLDLATGKVSTLAVLDKDIYGGLCASPDDAYVVWAQMDRSGSDLMLVEQFR